MSNLTTIDDHNLGGISKLKFAPRHFFSSLDPAVLIFKPGLDWILVDMIPETGSVDHTGVPDDAGDHYNVVISALLPKERQDIDAIISLHQGKDCLVECTDQNGYLRLAGHDLGELILNHSSSTGQAVADPNGYRISFTGKQRSKALFISPDVL